ncbi:hypothetical protein [Rubrivirga sp. IMCC43871]|uniref:hypothetical protein n=1 Tax=Rubrivirga sp. IMCC43871 TaxID=3391575 RepID=UPI00398FB7F9
MPFAHVERYHVEVGRARSQQATLRLDARHIGFGPTASRRPVLLMVRFREDGDQLRQEIVGHEGTHDSSQPLREDGHDHYPGEGPVQTVPYIGEVEGVVWVQLPMRDFDRMLHLLQTESPVYCRWEAPLSSAGGIDYARSSLALTTFAEPPGEGPADDSP